MKKMKLLPYLAFALLGLCSCKAKLEPQNPEIKLSEEHGKMLNLIFNITADYADWCIDFDTSSDNYYIIAEYSDIENKKLSDMKIYQLQYCNGIITDMTKYKYIVSDGVTSKTDYLKIRWDESKINVTSGRSKYSFLLEDPDALILEPGKEQLFGLPLGYGIMKLEDGSYHFLTSSSYFSWEGKGSFPENKGDSLIFSEEDGESFLGFISKEESYSIKGSISEMTTSFGLPYKLYVNGKLSYDMSVSCAYKFDEDEKERKTGTYSYFDVVNNLDNFAKKKIDKVEYETSKIFREYDDSGRLIYEKRIPEKQLYEGTRSGTVRMITKSIPDIKDFDKSLRQQIRILGAR